MAIVIRMPEIATGAAEAAIQTWLVAVGDTISAGQPIVEIETEKAVVEYEAEQAGVLASIVLAEGTPAPVGAPIAVLAADGESADEALHAAGSEVSAAAPTAPTATEAPATATPAEPATAPQPAAVEPASTEPGRRLFASPLVRRLARERGIDLDAVTGTGPNGRIVRRDIEQLSATASTAPAAAASAPVTPAPAATAPVNAHDTYEDTPHTGMRRAIARRLSESKSTVPHFYLNADCRVDELLALREQVNRTASVKISVNDFIVKAVAAAMQDVPEANAIWTDEATRRFRHADIAVAVSVPSGLLTPVVRGVDTLTLSQISAHIKDLAERARAGRLKQHELEGGSFSVSNLGMYGTEQFSAIINPPHAGILAVGAATRRPVVDDDGALAVATVMTVTLSADHRVLDGALPAQWLAAFVARIENPLSILI